MNDETTEARIQRLEQSLQQVYRETRGGVARYANQGKFPALRLAQITTEPDEHTFPDDVNIWGYGIKFVDGTFTESATVQAPTLTTRATTEYFAAAVAGVWYGVGHPVFVAWINGRWWLVQSPAPKMRQGTAQEDASAPDTVSMLFSGDADPTDCLLYDGLVLTGEVYNLLDFGGGTYVIIDPALSVIGIAQGDYAETASGLFKVGGSIDFDMDVIQGPVDLDGEYLTVWINDGWVMLGAPDGGSGSPNLTGTADQFLNWDDGSGDFTTNAGTVTATLSRGLVLDGVDYGLVWADEDHYAVVDPELSFVGKPSAMTQAGSSATFTVYAGTKGSEATTGETVSVHVREGLVLADKFYRVVWVDNDWEVENPSLTVRGKTAADVSPGASATLDIYTGTFGSETQPTGNPSVSSVRNDSSCAVKGSQIATAQWVHDNGGWQFIGAKTS